jgi:predicted RNA methylase
VRRAALSVAVRLLLLPAATRRAVRSLADLDEAIEDAFPGAPPRAGGDDVPLPAAPPRERSLEELARELETRLSREERKSAGAFFTPPEVARALARRALEGVARGVVIDPACGAGALLVAASEAVPRGVELLGVDADPDAVLVARARLAGRARVLHGDALATAELARELAGREGALLAPPVALPAASAVIANPPFVASYARGAVALAAARRELLARRFPGLGAGERNGFLHFLALGRELVGERGRLGFVVPDALLVNERYERARRELLLGPVEALLLDWPAFGRASVRAALLVVGPRARTGRRIEVRVFRDARALEEDRAAEEQVVSHRALSERPAFAFPRGATDVALERKIRARGVPLGDLCWVRDGINPGPRVFRERILVPLERSRLPRGLHPCVEGKDVKPFQLLPPRLAIDTDPALLTPELRRSGASFREAWIFESEKLVSRQTSPTLVFARDKEGGVHLVNSAHATGRHPGTEESLLYFLAVLNSSALRWYYARSSGETRRVFPQVHVSALRRLPVPRGEERHDALVALARALEERPDDRDALGSLDEHVFSLLGLSAAERRAILGEALFARVAT